MQLARVLGTVVATVKDPTLSSQRLLLIQPVALSGALTGAPLVALDGVGVGAGEEVMFVKGREAAFAFLPDTVLADAAIVGKVDAVDTHSRAPGIEAEGRTKGASAPKRVVETAGPGGPLLPERRARGASAPKRGASTK